jgi:hypothetical protein
MKVPYEIEYTKGFTIFWGVMFVFAIVTNGAMSVAFVALVLLTLIHHEHAHIKAAFRAGVAVKAVEFNWLGGLVNVDVNNPKDSRNILVAGVFNTACYAVVFNAIVIAIYIVKPIGLNFANNPYLIFLDSCALFTACFVVANILPFSFKSKKYGRITTDGYGAYLMHKEILREERWNDSVRISLDQLKNNVRTQND